MPRITDKATHNGIIAVRVEDDEIGGMYVIDGDDVFLEGRKLGEDDPLGFVVRELVK